MYVLPRKEFSSPDQRASRLIAIRPDVRRENNRTKVSNDTLVLVHEESLRPCIDGSRNALDLGSAQLREMDHEVIVANARELRAISHINRKSDTVDAEKVARYARVDQRSSVRCRIARVAQQEALTLIRVRSPSLCAAS